MGETQNYYQNYKDTTCYNADEWSIYYVKLSAFIVGKYAILIVQALMLSRNDYIICICLILYYYGL